MKYQLTVTFENAKEAAQVAKLLSAYEVGAKPDAPAGDDEDEKPQPKKRGRPPKAKEPEEDDDLEGDDDEDGSDAEDDELDDSEDDAAPPAKKTKGGPTHEDVLKAGKAYMAKNGKDKAHAILKKLGVKAVKDVPADKLATALKLFTKV